jgi:hypothetical protein
MLTRGLFSHAGRDPAEVARDTVGLSSAIAGALFVPIAWGLAVEIGRGRAAGRLPITPAAREAPRRSPPSERAGVTWLLFLALIAQGYLQLFFGYVENYTLYCLVIAAFALFSMRALDGRAPLVLPGAMVILAVALHLAGALLVPAFGVLVAQVAIGRRRWRPAARDLVICLGLFMATNLALGRLAPHYSWFDRLSHLAGSVTRSGSSYGFRRPDGGDFLNQQALIGPLGLFLFLPVAVAAALGGALRNGKGLWLMAMGSAYLLASVIAGDSNLGVARNWDLLAPAGFVFTLAGLGLALQSRW